MSYCLTVLIKNWLMTSLQRCDNQKRLFPWGNWWENCHLTVICYQYLQIFSPISTDMETFTDMNINRYIGTSAATDTDISVLPILVNIGRYRYANPGCDIFAVKNLGWLWLAYTELQGDFYATIHICWL